MATKNFTNGSQTLPLNNVTRAELINWAHYLQFEAGTIMKAIDELDNQTGLIRQTNGTPGAKAAAAVTLADGGTWILDDPTATVLRQTLEDSETISSTPFAIDVTKKNSVLTHSATASGTIGSGSYVGHEKRILLTGAGAGYVVTLTGTFKGFTQVKFGEVAGNLGFDVVLVWNGAAWDWVGGTAQIS